MKANYGYMDGSGEYYITIDTGKCEECEGHECLKACPADLFQIIENDYEDMVAEIKGDKRQAIKYDCAPCKPLDRKDELPCMSGCPHDAIAHSW